MEEQKSNIIGDLISTGISTLSLKAKIIIIVVIVFVILLLAILCMIINNGNSASEITFLNDAIFPIPIQCENITITSLFGYRNCPYHGNELHGGIDLVGPDGCEVICVENGEVVTSTYNSSYGNTVVVKHYMDIDFDGEEEVVYTRVAHMKETPLVNVGDVIPQGTVLGYQGSTGNSTGSHCHFEVMINKYGTSGLVDPAKYLGIKDAHSGQSIRIEKIQHKGSFAEEGDGYSKVTKVGLRSYKEYKQTSGSYSNKPYWNGDIMYYGCGPTALAIIASGYGRDETPLTLANYIKANMGNYTSNDILRRTAQSKCKLLAHSYTSKNSNKIKETLKDGNPVLVSVTASKGKGSLYANTSHYIALLDIDDKDKVYVSNPNEYKKGGWRPLSEIIGCLETFITFN